MWDHLCNGDEVLLLGECNILLGVHIRGIRYDILKWKWILDSYKGQFMPLVYTQYTVNVVWYVEVIFTHINLYITPNCQVGIKFHLIEFFLE